MCRLYKAGAHESKGMHPLSSCPQQLALTAQHDVVTHMSAVKSVSAAILDVLSPWV